MKRIIFKFFDKFLNGRLDLRVRLFNVLAMAGIIMSVIMTFNALLSGAGIFLALMDLLGAFLAFCILYYSYRTGRYQQCYMMTIIAIFLILFPVIFFTGGGYNGAMISFFIFAVVFTAFMLEGKKMFVMVGLELCVYVGICLFAYQNPNMITSFENETVRLINIISGLVFSSLFLGGAMSAQFKLYNEQQRLLANQNAALEQINQMKTEFLANVSHELKTPLTVVSGYAQTSEMQLSGQPENAAVQNKMKLISSEAERLALMVSQVLDVTRIEEGRMVFDPQPCRIDEIIQSAVDTHFPILNKNNNKLKLQIESGLPRVYADPMRLTQVIVNLVANAIRFTSGGVITISARSLDAFVEVAVSDTGRGIEPERLPHIFERYNRGEGSGDTGTGLGLFICKHIVEGHGGVISVQSETDKGAAFRFTVPVSAQ